MNKMVSFDFDDTLSRESVQKFAKELIDKDIDVMIVTSRYKNPKDYPVGYCNFELGDDLHDDLYGVAKELGITKIHFTNFEDKYKTLEVLNKEKEIVFHLDDARFENELINEKTKIKAVNSLRQNWKSDCIKILQRNGMYE